MSFRRACLAAVGVALIASPAAAQRSPLSVNLRAATQSDSVSGSGPSANSGLFIEPRALYRQAGPRLSITFGSHARVRQSAGAIGFDQKGADASVDAKRSRTLSIAASARLLQSSRLTLGVPGPEGATTPTIEVPGINTLTSGASLRLTRIVSRRRTDRFDFSIDRLAISGGSRTTVTQRLAAETTYQATPQTAVTIRPMVTSRANQFVEFNDTTRTFEAALGVKHRLSSATSVSAAAIPALFARSVAASIEMHIGGAAGIEHAWSPRWKSTFAAQQSILSGEGDTAPTYARSMSAGLNGRIGRVSLDASLLRVIAQPWPGASTTGHSGALRIAMRSPLSKSAALAAEWQYVTLPRSAVALPDALRSITVYDANGIPSLQWQADPDTNSSERARHLRLHGNRLTAAIELRLR